MDANNYKLMSLDEYAAMLEDMRFKDSGTCDEWQCPSCKNRVTNLQRLTNKDGEPMWGCGKGCDTHDAAYFAGRACNCYEKGDSGWAWF